MIHRLLISLCFFVPLYFLHAQHAPVTLQPKEEAAMIRDLILKNHVNPRPINDDFSNLVFRQFIEALDPRALYFTEAEIKELSTVKTEIDNDLNGKGWAALPKISNVYKTRLQNAKVIIEKILKEPFNFQTNEMLISSGSDTLEFSVSEAKLTGRWRKWLKYQALSINYNSNKDTDVIKAIAPDKEAALRQKILAIEKRNITRILEHPSGFDNYMRSVFYNTILFCQDPHSYYMSVSGYQNMQSALSTEDLSFGIDLEEDEFGNIVVERLQPGGPAWRTNQIHKSDILTQVKWEGKDAMDLSGADLEEVSDLLSSSNSAKLEFTFKKQSGETVTVILAKEKLTDGQDIVKSFILQGGKKIGYISLPGFYSEWENSAGSGCSNDVAKEIVKLKKENIQGLILDVRYNGGGSLQEGLDLAGIFINEGPLSVIKNKEKPIVAKDLNRGTVYDGPLLLMVNRQSASASELLGAALQDYNRAVIVGNSSFGKATGQQIMLLDTTYNEMEKNTKQQADAPRGGYAAVTIFKLYRLTGKSVQKKGIKPDIHLPDIFDNMEYSEANYPLALENDSIFKKIYYIPYPPLPISKLKQNSAIRIKQVPSFNLLTGTQNNIRQLVNLDSIPLNFQLYNKFAREKSAFWKNLEKSQSKAHADFSINSNLEDQELLKIDTYGKEINASLVSKLQQDIYLQESFSIINDMINLQTK